MKKQKAQNVKVPKILAYDIETSPNLGFIWGKYDQTVLDYTLERELLCFSYCWVSGGPDNKVHVETRRFQKSDKSLAKKLYRLLDSADVVLTQNGVKFDNKIARTRMLAHGIPPLKRLANVDTRKVASDNFGFNGNSLEDLARFFKLGGKLPNPGIRMWLSCMVELPGWGRIFPEAMRQRLQVNSHREWNRMHRYNAHDTRLLVGVYKKMKSWILDHPNVARLMRPPKVPKIRPTPANCVYCGQPTAHRRGLRVSRARIFQRFHCQNLRCRGWSERPINESDKEKAA